MVFYLDVILILNFIIDYFILLAVAKLLHLNIKKTKLIISALLGSLYSLIFLVPIFDTLYILIMKLIVSLIMMLVAFGFIHLMHFIRVLAVFYFVTFVTGGGVFALQYLLNIEHKIVNGIYVSKTSNPIFTLTIILVAFLGILVLTNYTNTLLRRKEDIDQKIVKIDIYLNNKVHEFIGLIDTGNRLYDPILRKPVMIIDADEVPFVPGFFKESYINGQFNLKQFEDIRDKLDNFWVSRVHLIPYKSVSSKMQFILAIRPDKVVIKISDNNILSQSNVLIGIHYGQLSNDNSYNAIIHPELLVG